MTALVPEERGADVRFRPPLVFAAAALAGTALFHLAAPPALPFARMAAIAAGIAMIAGGIALGLAALLLFRRTGQDPHPWTPSPQLVFAGPYRFTRNPMYVGMTAAQIGLGLAFGNLWVILLAPAALAIVHAIAVRPEERYLAEKFGEPYRDYCARVRRYI